MPAVSQAPGAAGSIGNTPVKAKVQGVAAKVCERWTGLTKNAKLAVVASGVVIFILCLILWYDSGTTELPPICTDTDPDRCFVPVKKAMNWDDARSYCEEHYAGLASIHSVDEQASASTACLSTGLSRQWTADDSKNLDKGLPHGCWIGLHRSADSFGWTDGSTIDYVNWWKNEPNDYGRTSFHGQGHPEGEDAVEMNFAGRGGAWNDDHVEGASAHNAADCADSDSCTVEGMLALCQTKAKPPKTGSILLWRTPQKTTEGRFIAVPSASSLTEAKQYCETNYAGLASIHSALEQSQANSACAAIAPANSPPGTPHGCWIGYQDRPDPTGAGGGGTGTWSWFDGSNADYANWAPGEPNNYGVDSGLDSSHGARADGETGSELITFTGCRDGAWNDSPEDGKAGHAAGDGHGGAAAYSSKLNDCWGCTGVYGYYPLCQTSPSTAVGGSTTAHHEMHEQSVGRFVVLPKALNYNDAIAACAPGQTSPNGVQLMGLASVHSVAEMQAISTACDRVAGGGSGQSTAGVPNGCWIGFRSNDFAQSGQAGSRTGFVWEDNSMVDFTFWSNGEPNNWGIESGGATASAEGESAVEVNMGREGMIHATATDSTEIRIKGLWNDAHVNGQAAHRADAYTGGTHETAAEGSNCFANFGASGAYGMFPVCQTALAQPSQPGSGTDQEGRTWLYKQETLSGNYVAIHQHQSWDGAKAYCERVYPGGGLASIHTRAQNAEAWGACHDLLGDVWDSDVAAQRNAAHAKGTTSSGIGGRRACGCWIGLNDRQEQDNKVFSDGTTVMDLPESGHPDTAQALSAYQECHGFPKPRGFWYTSEPNGLGSGAGTEDCVEIRMCFDPYQAHKAPSPPGTRYTYAQRSPETHHYQNNCPAATAHGLPYDPTCKVVVDFGARTGNPGRNLPPSPEDPRVWNDEAGAHPQPFICEKRLMGSPAPPPGVQPGPTCPNSPPCTNGPPGPNARMAQTCQPFDQATPRCLPTYVQANCCC